MRSQVEIDAAINRLQGWLGRPVVVEESICRLRSANHDQRLATLSRFVTKLLSVGVRTSGAALIFEGEEAQYEVALKCIEQLDFVGGEEIVIIEAVGGQTVRRSRLTVRG